MPFCRRRFAGAASARPVACCSSGRPSIPACSMGIGFRGPGRGDAGRRPEGSSTSTGSPTAGAAGRAPASRLDPGREQRDRRHPAGCRGGRADPSRGRASAQRRRPGRRQNPLDSRRSGRMSSRFLPISSAGRRASAPSSWPPTASSSPIASFAAAGRSGAIGPAPRTSPASSASALRPRLRPAHPGRSGPQAGRTPERCATPPRRALRAHRAGRGRVRRRRRRLPNTLAFAIPGHAGRDGADPVRSRRRRPVLRLGLLVGQGQAFSCARCHGRARRRSRTAPFASVSAGIRPKWTWIASSAACEKLVAALYERRAAAA